VSQPRAPLILLTGATGYVGGALLPLLARAGHRVRCLARRPDAVVVPPGAEVEVVAGDVFDPPSLAAALVGVTTAYYLVHSMAAAGDFEARDREAARNFGAAARAAGVRRIIYLGGLGDESAALSSHLRSRHEVGALLCAPGVPVVEFRASIVIGAGSLSFEMIRALVERLPVMVAPRWVSVLAQPIAISDLLRYLLAALDLAPGQEQVFEIGGADRVSYGGLMREYARQRALRRWIIPVRVLTPRLSSLWLALVTPLYARVGRKLIGSMRHPTVVEDPAALSTFKVPPLGFREAIAEALATPGYGRLLDERRLLVAAPPAAVFRPIARIGGTTGWYYAGWLWKLRGALDRLLGGPGMSRGRRHPEELREGEVLDCWRVETLEPGRRLRLRAEMKLPGRAWLEFEVTPRDAGSLLLQRAVFDPRGVLGRAYWYAVYPLHQLVFGGLIRALAAAAVRHPH
jgi:uncharacterized protein YbjT (DUF2867 family)